jgi:hypothetical protein
MITTVTKEVVKVADFVTLAYMEKLNEVDFEVDRGCGGRYVVHFNDPTVFKVEFAELKEGSNLFVADPASEAQTWFRIFADVSPMQIRGVLALAPTTNPIVIPPRR